MNELKDIFETETKNVQNDDLFNELINESNLYDDPLDKTTEIETFEFDKEELEILKIKKEEPEKKKKWWHLPMTTAKDHDLEYAFVHCSVLAFITAFMGAGMLTYIINHI